MFAVDPDLFVTSSGMFVLGVASLLNPITAGTIETVCDPVVIASVTTPAFGSGSTFSARLESAVLFEVFE